MVKYSRIGPDPEFVAFSDRIKSLGDVERFKVDIECPKCNSHLGEAISSRVSRDVLAVICCACGHDW
jgi:hypothetical protein